MDISERRKWNPQNWGPGPILIVNLLYLAILAFLFIGWHNRWPVFAKFTDPISGFLPVGVPWFGALGALTISLYGVVNHQTNWNKRWNLWHLTRPIVGMILGTMSFLIFIAVDKASTDTLVLGTGIKQIPYFAISFAIGYREQTFRRLITKLIDTLLTPGNQEASVSIGPSPVVFSDVKRGSSAEQVITISNSGNVPLLISGGASLPGGLVVDEDDKPQFKILGNALEGATISAGASAAFIVCFTPTEKGPVNSKVTLRCNAGIYFIPLQGHAIEEVSGSPKITDQP